MIIFTILGMLAAIFISTLIIMSVLEGRVRNKTNQKTIWQMNNIKKNVKSLWTWKDDNFTCIYENYSGDDRIYTSNQLLKILTK